MAVSSAKSASTDVGFEKQRQARQHKKAAAEAAAKQAAAYREKITAIREEDAALVAECIRTVQTELKGKLGNDWHIMPIGSCVTGFSGRPSTVDVTCYPHELPGEDPPEETLKKVYECLSEHVDFTEVKQHGESRPRVSAHYYHSDSEREKPNELDVVVTVNNLRAIKSLQLQKAYKEVHEVIPELVMHVKRWAVSEKVHGEEDSNLGTYAFFLMVIYYLQVVHLCPALDISLFHGWRGTELARTPLWTPAFVDTMQLLQGFFAFYIEHYSWQEQVVSVRLGRPTYRREWFSESEGSEAIWTFDKLGENQEALFQPRFHVEDPFEESGIHRNLNDTLEFEKEKRLYFKILEAYRRLMQGTGLPNSLMQISSAIQESAVNGGFIPAGYIGEQSPSQNGQTNSSEGVEEQAKVKGERQRGRPVVDDDLAVRFVEEAERTYDQGQRGYVWTWARKDAYSSAAVQRAIDVTSENIAKKVPRSERQMDAILTDLHGHVHTATEHPCANFVLQHIVDQCGHGLDPTYAAFIIRELRGKELWASKHRFGCRVVLRFVQRCHDPQQKWDPLLQDTPAALMAEVLKRADEMVTDKFANYVIQEVIQHGIDSHKHRVADVLLNKCHHIARDQHGCRVVEGALTEGNCSREDRRRLATQLLKDPKPLLESRYGCFVFKKMLSLEEFKEETREVLKDFEPVMDKSWYARRLKPLVAGEEEEDGQEEEEGGAEQEQDEADKDGDSDGSEAGDGTADHQAGEAVAESAG
eukprot:CAMPEP_0178392508 /NCGR_PEP_ID=MMETSP0689_2-20121128/11714_1 /TAXON_ID=160604 /ORGANISM="Amphidinium massartii, Strain CS-259" /LENGTH=754 /DNA_ID=CAMNT_0020013083 /DNA_START=32 /DNA_END=2296 /DNA_ORIENTATION=+